MVFVMSVRLFEQKFLHNIASSSSFFRFRSDFLAFFARISYFKFLEFKEFNKKVIPFARAGYEICKSLRGFVNSLRGATRLVVVYHLKFNKREWNNCELFTPEQLEKMASVKGEEITQINDEAVPENTEKATKLVRPCLKVN